MIELLKGLMEVECIGWEKAAGTSRGLAIIAINMATLGDTAQRCPNKLTLLSRQRKWSITRELPRAAVKIKVANEVAMAARASEINNGARAGSSVGTCPTKRAYGMSCGRSGELPSALPVHWNPIPTQNRFGAFRETDGHGENLEPSDSKMHNQCLLVRESIGVLGARPNEVHRSMPLAKFTQRN